MLSGVSNPGSRRPLQPADHATIRTRRAPIRTVVFTLSAQAIVLWGALGDPRWERAVREASDGWIDPTLPAGVLLFVVSIVPFVFIRAKLRPRDIGLDRRKLRNAVNVVVGLWLATQLILAWLGLLVDGWMRVDPLWFQPGAPARPIAFLIAMLIIMPALEEATFRGFVLPQLWLRLQGSARVRTWGAVVGSAVLFALIHVPSRRLIYGLDSAGFAASLAGLVAFGILMALIYLRTANLWVTGGIHALLNAPTPVLAGPLPALLVMVPLVLGLVIFWPRLPWVDRPLMAGTRIEVDEAPA